MQALEEYISRAVDLEKLRTSVGWHSSIAVHLNSTTSNPMGHKTVKRHIPYIHRKAYTIIK